MLPEDYYTTQDLETRALRIVIADDHRLVLGALARTLDEDPGFDVVGVTVVSSRVLGLVWSPSSRCCSASSRSSRPRAHPPRRR